MIELPPFNLDGEIRDGRHVMPVRVYYEDTDFSGVVYHANFLRFMERGRTNFLRLLGADQRGLFEEAAREAPGFAFVVRTMTLDFLKAARMDDVLRISAVPGQPKRGGQRIRQVGQDDFENREFRSFSIMDCPTSSPPSLDHDRLLKRDLPHERRRSTAGRAERVACSASWPFC